MTETPELTRRAALARELLVFGGYLLIAIVFTWPLAKQLPTLVSDNGDPLLNTWILNWDHYATLHRPLSLYQAPIFHPSILPLAYSENLYGIAIPTLPLYLIGLAPLTIYNVAMLLGFAMSAYGAWVLARVITRAMVPSLVAGLFYGFVAFRFDHLAHLQIVWSGWLPLMLAALFVYWRAPRPRNAVLLSAAFLMNGLTNIHWLLFGALALVLTIGFLALAGRPQRGWRFWLQLAGALAVAGALLLPFLIPYRIVSKEYHMKRGLGEITDGSAIWSDWLVAPDRSYVYGRLPDETQSHNERHLWPGGMVLFLLGAAIVLQRRGERDILPEHPAAPGQAAITRVAFHLRLIDALIVISSGLTYLGAVMPAVDWRVAGIRILDYKGSKVEATIAIALIFVRLSLRLPLAFGGNRGRALRDVLAESRFPIEAWASALWIAVGVLGSLGTNTFFHSFLFARIEVFRSIRTPSRWAMIAYAGLAVWAALGTAALLARKPAGRRLAAGTLIVILMLVDLSVRIRWDEALPETNAVYRWMARTQPGPALELPIGHFDEKPYLYVLASTAHHVPILNGVSGFEPPSHSDLRQRIEDGKLDDEIFTRLERYGCRLLIVHADWLQPHTARFAAWLRAALDSGRLGFIGRFDNGLPDGDWVFALTRTDPQWARRRLPQALNTAGQTPDESLARFLGGKPTYSGSTIAWLDRPDFNREIRRDLRVSGWALAPSGIRRVTVIINCGSMRFPAKLGDRGDVQHTFPWYPAVQKAGFVMQFEKRPKGTPRDTSFQVEIEDGNGRIVRTPNHWIHWP